MFNNANNWPQEKKYRLTSHAHTTETLQSPPKWECPPQKDANKLSMRDSISAVKEWELVWNTNMAAENVQGESISENVKKRRGSYLSYSSNPLVKVPRTSKHRQKLSKEDCAEDKASGNGCQTIDNNYSDYYDQSLEDCGSFDLLEGFLFFAVDFMKVVLVTALAHFHKFSISLMIRRLVLVRLLKIWMKTG